MPREQPNIGIRLASDGLAPVGNGGEADSVADAGNHSGGDAVLASQHPGAVVIDPADVGGGSDDSSGGTGPGEPEPRRRGRKPGSRNKPRSQKAGNLNPHGLELMLFSTHKMLASMTGAAELELDKDESAALAEAASAVARHYDFELPEKTVDWYNLMTMCGAIYGPRIVTLFQKARGKTRTPAATVAQPQATTAAPARPVVVEPAPSKPGSDIIEIPGLAPFRRSMN